MSMRIAIVGGPRGDPRGDRTECLYLFAYFIFVPVDIIIISSESEDSDHDGAVPGANR